MDGEEEVKFNQNNKSKPRIQDKILKINIVSLGPNV